MRSKKRKKKYCLCSSNEPSRNSINMKSYYQTNRAQTITFYWNPSNRTQPQRNQHKISNDEDAATTFFTQILARSTPFEKKIHQKIICCASLILFDIAKNCLFFFSYRALKIWAEHSQNPFGSVRRAPNSLLFIVGLVWFFLFGFCVGVCLQLMLHFFLFGFFVSGANAAQRRRNLHCIECGDGYHANAFSSWMSAFCRESHLLNKQNIRRMIYW